MLQNWLQPIQIKLPTYEAYQLGRHISIYQKRLPAVENVKIALIGIEKEEANLVRTALYELANHFPQLPIVDLGNVRNQTVDFLIPIFKELLSNQIIPIIIGKHDDFIKAQQQAHRQSQRHSRTWVSIDDRARYDSHFRSGHYQIIGNQAHLSDPSILKKIEQKGWDTLSLGNAKANLKQTEPLLRDADFLTVRLSALKGVEAPAQTPFSPSGFWLEEMCQLVKYAGFSDKLTSMSLLGFDAIHHDRTTANAAAQIIWYAIDGIYNRKQDYPITTGGLTEYLVYLKTQDLQITFWKSQKTGRWWLQIPSAKTNVRLIPCSYEDYQMAAADEISDRLTNILRRFG